MVWLMVWPRQQGEQTQELSRNPVHVLCAVTKSNNVCPSHNSGPACVQLALKCRCHIFEEGFEYCCTAFSFFVGSPPLVADQSTQGLCSDGAAAAARQGDQGVEHIEEIMHERATARQVRSCCRYSPRKHTAATLPPLRRSLLSSCQQPSDDSALMAGRAPSAVNATLTPHKPH